MNISHFLHRFRARWALVAAFLAPLGTAASFVPLRGLFTNVGAALVFVALIEGLAIWGRRPAAYVATISSALWFDFFLAPPFERFTISHRPDLETTVSLVLVGVVVTELAAQSRRHRVRAGTERAHVAMLATAAASMTGSSTLDDVLMSTSSSVRDLLHLRSCHFETPVSGPPYAQILADGRVLHVGMSWPVEEYGIPGPETQIECQWRGELLGRFVLRPTPGETVTLEDRVTAVALVNTVSALVYEQHRARG